MKNPKMSNGKTVDELYQLIRLSVDSYQQQNIDITQLNYVIYARKSTVGDERQEHSIEDQIALCIEREAKPNNLRAVKVIREKGSAKEPDIRPKFRQLLEDTRNGVIDGIIAYHPDRLSRNMREAGDIIDMLDKHDIKDLRFVTSTFENSPTGKMLLELALYCQNSSVKT